MSKEIEKLIKIQGRINKNKFHLCVNTNLTDQCDWVLFLFNPNIDDYFSSYNMPILSSRIDSIEYLEEYLKKHDGFSRF